MSFSVNPVTASVLPVYVVIDESGSMADHIDVLNDGLTGVIDVFHRDPLSAETVRLSIIGFSDTATAYLSQAQMATVDALPRLKARHSTSYSAAFDWLRINIKKDIDAHRATGVRVRRPAVFFFTDGEPTDSRWLESHDLLLESAHRPNIIAIGVGDAQAATLQAISSRYGFAFQAREDTPLIAAIESFLSSLTGSVVASVADVSRDMTIEFPDGFLVVSPEDDDDVFL